MRLCILLFFLLATFSGWGQRVDVAPSGQAPYRAVEGGGSVVVLDTVTPLDTLVKRLEGNWHFEETGKAYWIGYPDLMYSIAAYKDKAIQPLLDLYSTTNTRNGKYGVIYTLHLIGIDSRITGRFSEEFVDTNARVALLQLAKDAKYRSTAISLLARDPWKSDLPTLARLLQENYNKTLVNALFRYTGGDSPFRQDIPPSLNNIQVYIEDTKGVFKIGELKTFYTENQQSNSDKGNAIENAVVQIDLPNGRVFRKFHAYGPNMKISQSYFKCDAAKLADGNCTEVNDVLDDLFMASFHKVSPFSFCDFDDAYHHYFNGTDFVICTDAVTRLRWLDYLKKKGILQ